MLNKRRVADHLRTRDGKKKLALHGLGLSIYAGEDLPLIDSGEDAPAQPKPIIPASAKVANFPPAEKRNDAITPAQVRYIQRLIEESGTELQRVLDYCGVEQLEDIAKSEASRVIKSLEQSRDRRAA